MSRLNWDKARRREVVAERGADPLKPSWWLILNDNRRCHECGHPTGANPAYCHEEQCTLCKACYERAGIIPRPSRKWLQASQGKRRKAR